MLQQKSAIHSLGDVDVYIFDAHQLSIATRERDRDTKSVCPSVRHTPSKRVIVGLRGFHSTF